MLNSADALIIFNILRANTTRWSIS